MATQVNIMKVKWHIIGSQETAAVQNSHGQKESSYLTNSLLSLFVQFQTGHSHISKFLGLINSICLSFRINFEYPLHI